MSEIFTDEQIKFFRDVPLTEEEIEEGYFKVSTDEDTMVALYGTHPLKVTKINLKNF